MLQWYNGAALFLSLPIFQYKQVRYSILYRFFAIRQYLKWVFFSLEAQWRIVIYFNNPFSGIKQEEDLWRSVNDKDQAEEGKSCAIWNETFKILIIIIFTYIEKAYDFSYLGPVYFKLSNYLGRSQHIARRNGTSESHEKGSLKIYP